MMLLSHQGRHLIIAFVIFFSVISVYLLLSPKLDVTLHTLRPFLGNELTNSISSPCHKCAYATFLSTRVVNETDDDPYFTAVRALNYQLLHQPKTKTNYGIPFIVLVPPHVAEGKRKILAAEGAVVIEVQPLEPDVNWVIPGKQRYIDQFTKLRIFEQQQYERILYVDGDMLLTRPLDGIWDEPIAQDAFRTLDIVEVKDPNQKEINATPPSEYTIIGVSDTQGPLHPIPPLSGEMFNGGFFMLRPSVYLYAYYTMVLNIEHAFDSTLMEQSLLNHVHRRNGSMPWKNFEPGKWNVNWPGVRDLNYGCASLHDKFWELGRYGLDNQLAQMWATLMADMDRFWGNAKARRGFSLGR
jgi:alpha-N-acetylglucosamine transferase